MADVKGFSVDIELNAKDFNAEIEKVTDNVEAAKNQIQSWKKAIKYDPSDKNAFKGFVEGLEELKKASEQAKANLEATYNALISSGAGTDNPRLRKTIEELTKLKKVIDTTIPSFDEFQDELNQTDDELEDMCDSTTDVLGVFDDIKEKIDFDYLSQGLSIAKEILNFGFEITEQIVSIYSTIAEYFGKIIYEGFNYNMTIEQYQTSFTAMLGSAQEAEELLQKLRETASSSSFSVEALVSANQALISSGISAEDATKAIDALGDALAYAGKDDDAMQRMAQNLQQIQTAGKASATDLKEFARAGIPIYKLLASYSEEFANGTNNITVTYDDIVGALELANQSGGVFYQAMTRNASTAQGQINQLKSNWLEFTGVLAQPINDYATSTLLPQLNDSLKNITEAFEENGVSGYVESIEEELPKIIEIIDEQAPEILESCINIIKSTLSALSELLNDPEIKSMVADLVSVVVSFFKDQEIMDILVSAAADLISMFNTALKQASKEAYVKNQFGGGTLFSDLIFGEDGIISDELIAKIKKWFTVNDTYSTYVQRIGNINSGSLGLQSGGLSLTTNINVTNNGTPINEREIRRWGNTITDIVSSNLGRRM